MANSRLKRLFNYLKPYSLKVFLGITALLIVNGLGVYVPLLIRNSIDQLQVQTTFNDTQKNVIFIIVLSSIMWILRMVSRIMIFGVGRQVEFDLKQKLFEHLSSLEPAYFGRNTIGDLINRSTSDVDNIRRLVGFAVLSLANTLFAYGLTLPVMLRINVKLTLFSIAVYPIMLVFVKLFSGRMQREQLTVQEELSNISDLIQEDMSGIGLIKIYAQEENEKRAFRVLNNRLLDASLALSKTRNILFPSLGGLASISLLVLLATGGGLIANKTISVGDFLALLIYVERLVFPTALLGFTITVYQRGEVSIDRIESILSVEPEIKDPDQPINLPSPVRGEIRANNLSYTYYEATTPALNNLRFTIKPGETVAIIGPIGCGKSTLANAIPRLLDIAPDQLFLDGCDITQLRLSDLRGVIAYVPQESFLFSTSIRNNISYGQPGADIKLIESAAKQAQIEQEILYFPQQYDTIVGERGITLSGGQRQRTALARALLVDTPILILDDALSSVDNQTATKILHNLSQGVKRKTVIFISHQMSAAASASDRIFVMDKGGIVQTGNHRELLAKQGLYQSLWNQQKLEELLK